MTKSGWGAVFILASGLFYSMERLHNEFAGLFRNPYVGLFLIVGLILAVTDWIRALWEGTALQEKPVQKDGADE